MDIDEAVFLAVKRNLGLAAEKLGPRLARTVVVERAAEFDPTTFAEAEVTGRERQTSTSLEGTDQETTTVRAGVSKRLHLGTTIDVHASYGRDWNNDPFTTVNPAYREEVGVRLTQPLLRGIGIRYNTAGIASAENEAEIARYALKQAALDTIAEAMGTYWELVFARSSRDLRQRSLRRAINLQRDVQAQVDARALGERDPSVAQAAAEVALRREELVVAEDAIRAAEDNLKVITDLASEPGIWQVPLVPTSEPPRTVPSYDLEGAVETALVERPDYQRGSLAVENRDIGVYVTGKELLPSLDLELGAGFSGLGDTRHSSRRSVETLDYDNWHVGLIFEYPLGNRAARARHRRAKLQRRGAMLELKGLEQVIQREVRDAIRAVETNAERLEAAEASVQAAEERLRAEEIRFREARMVTLQDVLDAEADLAEAEIRSLRALIDLNQSIVEVERRVGTLLDTANVRLQDAARPEPARPAEPEPEAEGAAQAASTQAEERGDEAGADSDRAGGRAGQRPADEG